ncbi:exodeoxyribonuclease VII large subunit [Methylibium sp.]|uniref:exodeoxyribonuclease VII large subunit n=1 Tax=Methylibium sp. TaxID=2067992 RepID=UPI003D143260
MPRTYLKVPFQQKDAAKSLGARWDAAIGSWYVPENIDPAPFTAWLSGSLRAVATAPPSATALTASAPGTAMAVPQKGVPLSQLLAGVASAVAAAYRGGVWTTVEVTEVKTRSGHVYLDLSERDRDATLIAKATGTIWASTANRILPEFERATGATLAPGIKLLLRARPVFKPQFGFSLDIDAIDPDYTLGDLEARKREIRARLQREGIFDAQKQLPAPWDFNAVLVVAPDGAAGLGDFQAESKRLSAHGVCEFVYVHSRFQGEGAAAEIAGALRAALDAWNRDHSEPPDAVVIIRGGGAVNDLAWLNDHDLARLVCNLAVPVFTGIGHERDSTVLDEVAHTSFDTPSKVIAGIEQVIVRRTREASDAFRTVVQAAGLAAQRARAAAQRLDAEVRAGAGRHVEFAKRRAAALFGDVKEVSVASIHEARMLIREGAAAVRQGSAQAVTTARRESRVNVDFVLERAGSHTMRARAAVDASFAVMSQGARQAVQDARRSSEALMREIAGQGPQKTLGRGFAIVRDTSDGPVTRAAQVAPGQAVSVQFADGSVRVKVDREKK